MTLHATLAIILAYLAASCSSLGVTTNLYHTNRVFRPIEFSPSGTPTAYEVYSLAGQLTQVVGPTNIIINSNLTKAVEYEGFAWGYENAHTAWTSTVSVYQNNVTNHPGNFYDNVGWVKGTREAYGTWGAYLWYLQNQIAFTSSPTNKWVSPEGSTNLIALVLVGSLGDYLPQVNVTDIGPTNWAQITNFLGEGVSEDSVYKPDLNTYYKLAIFTFTIYVDQPGRGGDDQPYRFSMSLNPIDVGHTFWRLSTTETNMIPDIYHEFLNVNLGFGPVSTGSLMLNYPETSGEVRRPDDSHVSRVDVHRAFQITFEQMTNCLAYSKQLYDSPTNYNLNTFNCTDAGVAAARAAGRNLPNPQTKWKGGGGSSPGAFGEELKKLPQ